MASSISWLDFDSKAREKSEELLKMFQEPGTLDEMGIGTIRDALSDMLFPGTSTLHTRIKYMLLIPWIYVLVESKKPAPKSFAAEIDAQERELIKVLTKEGADKGGVIGATSGENLQRLPSVIYWTGLKSWGLRKYEGSQSAYTPSSDDNERAWHDYFYKITNLENHFKEQTLELTKKEAGFLKARLTEVHKDTCLGFLAKRYIAKEAKNTNFPWEYFESSELNSLDKPNKNIARVLMHAKLFSYLMQGANLLYYYLLAKEKKDEGHQNKLQKKLSAWLEEETKKDFDNWALDEFFSCIEKGQTRYKIAKPQRDFVTSWFDTVKKSSSFEDLLEDDGNIIREREIAKKGLRSRFIDKSALDRWKGGEPTPLSYRWAVIKRYMDDLHKGLNNHA